jgi:hypothetical protein
VNVRAWLNYRQSVLFLWVSIHPIKSKRLLKEYDLQIQFQKLEISFTTLNSKVQYYYAKYTLQSITPNIDKLRNVFVNAFSWIILKFRIDTIFTNANHYLLFKLFDILHFQVLSQNCKYYKIVNFQYLWSNNLFSKVQFQRIQRKPSSGLGFDHFFILQYKIQT